MNNPLVSVIIPTFERPDNLLRAIESVNRQSYNNIEIIVVDDNGIGSYWQQHTRAYLNELIEKNVISYVAHDINKNGAAARNTGLRNSKGDFINFLDDDDEFSDNKIEKNIEYLQNNPNVDAVFCDTIFKTNGIVTESFVNSNNFSHPATELLLGNLKFNTSTLLFRRAAIEAINGFDESYIRHQDYELTVRFCERFKLMKSENCYIIKNQTPNIISKNPLRAVDFLNKFISDFEHIFLMWNQGKEVISHRYEVLARDLASQGYSRECFRCLLKANKYKTPSFKIIGKCIFHCLKNIVG